MRIPLFAGYRNVPWLARTHAVTMVPSVSGVVARCGCYRPARPARQGTRSRSGIRCTSRRNRRGRQSRMRSLCRSPRSMQQDEVRAAGSSNVTRGLPLKRRSAPKLEGVDSAELALLPRLPDTADELKSIALALQADPSKVLNLGKDANEQKVKTMDLSGFKIVAFATHGLVPGRTEWSHPACTRPVCACRIRLGRRRASDHGRDSHVSSSMLTGSCCRRAIPELATGAGCGSRFRTWPRVLLCRHPGACSSPTGRCIRNRRVNS